MTTDNRTNEMIVAEALAGTGSVSNLQIERAIAALEAAGRLVRELDEAKLAEVIDQAEKSTLTGSKPGRQRVIARAVAAYLRGES